MQFSVKNNLPEQSSPRPSEHRQIPSSPQVPWPLHVVLGLQNSNRNEKGVLRSLYLRIT